MDSLHLHYPPSISCIRLSYPSLCNHISQNQWSLLALGIHNPSLRDPPIKSFHQASSFEIQNPSPRDLRNPSSINLTLWNLVASVVSFHHPSPYSGFLFIALCSFLLHLPCILSLLPLVHLIPLYHSPIVRVWANSTPSFCRSESPCSSQILVFFKKSSSLVFSPRRFLEGASRSPFSPLLL